MTTVLVPAAPEVLAPDYDGPAVAPFEGVIGVEGMLTGDGRLIQESALQWATFPLPLRWASADFGGHDGAVIVGRIDSVERRDNGDIYSKGVLDLGSKEGRECARLMRGQFLSGVSMDLDSVDSFEAEVQLFSEDGEPAEGNSKGNVLVTGEARVRAATLVAIPAFDEARLSLIASMSAGTREELSVAIGKGSFSLAFADDQTQRRAFRAGQVLQRKRAAELQAKIAAFAPRSRDLQRMRATVEAVTGQKLTGKVQSFAFNPLQWRVPAGTPGNFDGRWIDMPGSAVSKAMQALLTNVTDRSEVSGQAKSKLREARAAAEDADDAIEAGDIGAANGFATEAYNKLVDGVMLAGKGKMDLPEVQKALEALNTAGNAPAFSQNDNDAIDTGDLEGASFDDPSPLAPATPAGIVGYDNPDADKPIKSGPSMRTDTPWSEETPDLGSSAPGYTVSTDDGFKVVRQEDGTYLATDPNGDTIGVYPGPYETIATRALNDGATVGNPGPNALSDGAGFDDLQEGDVLEDGSVVPSAAGDPAKGGFTEPDPAAWQEAIDSEIAAALDSIDQGANKEGVGGYATPKDVASIKRMLSRGDDGGASALARSKGLTALAQAIDEGPSPSGDSTADDPNFGPGGAADSEMPNEGLDMLPEVDLGQAGLASLLAKDVGELDLKDKWDQDIARKRLAGRGFDEAEIEAAIQLAQGLNITNPDGTRDDSFYDEDLKEYVNPDSADDALRQLNAASEARSLSADRLKALLLERGFTSSAASAAVNEYLTPAGGPTVPETGGFDAAGAGTSADELIAQMRKEGFGNTADSLNSYVKKMKADADSGDTVSAAGYADLIAELAAKWAVKHDWLAPGMLGPINNLIAQGAAGGANANNTDWQAQLPAGFLEGAAGVEEPINLSGNFGKNADDNKMVDDNAREVLSEYPPEKRFEALANMLINETDIDTDEELRAEAARIIDSLGADFIPDADLSKLSLDELDEDLGGGGQAPGSRLGPIQSVDVGEQIETDTGWKTVESISKEKDGFDVAFSEGGGMTVSGNDRLSIRANPQTKVTLTADEFDALQDGAGLQPGTDYHITDTADNWGGRDLLVKVPADGGDPVWTDAADNDRSDARDGALPPEEAAEDGDPNGPTVAEQLAAENKELSELTDEELDDLARTTEWPKNVAYFDEIRDRRIAKTEAVLESAIAGKPQWSMGYSRTSATTNDGRSISADNNSFSGGGGRYPTVEEAMSAETRSKLPGSEALWTYDSEGSYTAAWPGDGGPVVTLTENEDGSWGVSTAAGESSVSTFEEAKSAVADALIGSFPSVQSFETGGASWRTDSVAGTGDLRPGQQFIIPGETDVKTVVERGQYTQGSYPVKWTDSTGKSGETLIPSESYVTKPTFVPQDIAAHQAEITQVSGAIKAARRLLDSHPTIAEAKSKYNQIRGTRSYLQGEIDRARNMQKRQDLQRRLSATDASNKQAWDDYSAAKAQFADQEKALGLLETRLQTLKDGRDRDGSAFPDDGPTVRVSSPEVKALLEQELRGQISDGLWENSSYDDDWRALGDADIIVDPKNTGSNFSFRKTYGFTSKALYDAVGDRMLKQIQVVNPNATEADLKKALKQARADTFLYRGTYKLPIAKNINGVDYTSVDSIRRRLQDLRSENAVPGVGASDGRVTEINALEAALRELGGTYAARASKAAVFAAKYQGVKLNVADCGCDEMTTGGVTSFASAPTEPSTDDVQAFANWVEQTGGLPRYIKRIAKHLQERGMTEGHAIASAVNTVKRWARGGGDVKPDTIAKAVAALAEWEAKKAAAHATAAATSTFASSSSKSAAGKELVNDLSAVSSAVLTVANDVAEAVGLIAPGTRAAGGHSLVTDVKTMTELSAELQKTSRRAAASLVASAGGTAKFAAPVAPPVAWFKDPQLTAATPIRVTPDGRIYGHLATWDNCHMESHALGSSCTKAPKSATKYAGFHLGYVTTAEGVDVPTGRIIAGAPHADPAWALNSTLVHYSHSGWVGADVRVGEDRYGIWIAGAVRPDVSPAQLRALKASPLSGDWREDPRTGRLELVAALAVNSPGFGIPRPTALVASTGAVTSMQAMGLLPPRTVVRPGTEGAFSHEDLVFLKERAAAVRAWSLEVSEARAETESKAAAFAKARKLEAFASTVKELR